MLDLHALSTDYQTLLEKHRQDPDDVETWGLLEQTAAWLFAAWADHVGLYADA